MRNEGFQALKDMFRKRSGSGNFLRRFWDLAQQPAYRQSPSCTARRTTRPTLTGSLLKNLFVATVRGNSPCTSRGSNTGR